MFTFTFTDPQGTDFIDAVFYLRTARYSRNLREHEYENYELSKDDFTSVVNEPAVTSTEASEGISYSFYYWTNQAARDAAKAPYILANMAQNNMTFSFAPDATYDGLTLKQKCEKHAQEVVLVDMV